MNFNFTGNASEMAQSLIAIMDERCFSRRSRKAGFRLTIDDVKDSRGDEELIAIELKENDFVFDLCEILVALRDQCNFKLNIDNILSFIRFDFLKNLCEHGSIEGSKEAKKMINHLFEDKSFDLEKNISLFSYKILMIRRVINSFKEFPNYLDFHRVI